MPNHIIHKQTVTLHIPGEDQSHGLQDTVSRMMRNGLAGSIEKILDDAAPGSEVIRIDKLALGLNIISAQNFEKEFKEQFLAAFKEKLSETISTVKSNGGEDSFLTPAAALSGSLLYFLSHGILPWYASPKNIREWEAEIIAGFTAQEWRQLWQMLRERPAIMERFVLQFSDALLAKALITNIPSLTGNWNAIYKDLLAVYSLSEIAGHSSAARNEVWLAALSQAMNHEGAAEQFVSGVVEALLQSLPAKAREDAHIREWGKNMGSAEVATALEKLAGGLTEDKETAKTSVENGEAHTKSEKNAKHVDTEVAGDAFFVQNSGVILLHPFLLMYFKEQGLLDEQNIFVNDDARKRAVLLLNYLATGTPEAAEYTLVLQKILCGLHIDEPMPASIVLTAREEEESASLLQAVTQHWPPLNHTSIEGLRTTFLQREGKLTRTDTGWRLRIAQTTVDILLGRLPWGYSAIKLPWMPGILNVDWQQ